MFHTFTYWLSTFCGLFIKIRIIHFKTWWNITCDILYITKVVLFTNISKYVYKCFCFQICALSQMIYDNKKSVLHNILISIFKIVSIFKSRSIYLKLKFFGSLERKLSFKVDFLWGCKLKSLKNHDCIVLLVQFCPTFSCC